eukprot:11072467-Lingulodinium_polyedra.AAC.1
MPFSRPWYSTRRTASSPKMSCRSCALARCSTSARLPGSIAVPSRATQHHGDAPCQPRARSALRTASNGPDVRSSPRCANSQAS